MTRTSSKLFLAGLILIFAVAPRISPQNTASPSVISIDAAGPAHALPHFWERMFGSERAIVTLRESWRDDLRAVKAITGFEYVRFHAVFHDEMGVYSEDAAGKPVFSGSFRRPRESKSI